MYAPLSNRDNASFDSCVVRNVCMISLSGVLRVTPVDPDDLRLSVYSCALQLTEFAAIIQFEMCSTVFVVTHVHESLYLRNNGFPYCAFLAFSCPVFSTTRNFVPHFHVAHLFIYK